MPPVREKIRVDRRDQRKETTRDCRGCKYRSPSGQLINHVVPRKKRMSGNLIEQEEREDSLRQKERTGLRESDKEEKRREMGGLLVLPRPAKSMQNGAGFSGKTGTYWAC